MRYLVLFIFLLFNHWSICQSTIPPYHRVTLLSETDTSSENIRAILYTAQANYSYFPEQEIRALNIALNLSKQSKNSDLQGSILQWLARTYHFKGDLPEAFEYLYLAQNIHDSLQDSIQIANDLVMLAYFYQSIEDFTLSEVYLDKAKNLSVVSNEPREMAFIKIITARNFIAIGNYSLAKVLAEEAYSIYDKIDSIGLGESYCVQAQAREKMQENELAMEFARRSIAFFNPIKANMVYQINPRLLIARIFNQRKEYDSAIHYANYSYRISKDRNYLLGCLLSCKEIANIYFSKGNNDSASFFQKLFVEYNEKFFNLKKAVIIKNQVLQAHSIELEKQRQYHIYISQFYENLEALGIVLFIFIASFFFIRFSKGLTVASQWKLLVGEFVILSFYEGLNVLLHFVMARYITHSLLIIFLGFLFLGAALVAMHHYLLKYLKLVFIPKAEADRLRKLEVLSKAARKESHKKKKT